jgi:hypothetical protein
MWLADDAAVVLTCLSAGSERLLKLTYGHLALAAGGDWPGTKIRGFGHRLNDLRADVDRQLRIHVDRATHPRYIRTLLAEDQADPYLDGIFAALDRWWAEPTSGRYRDLQTLAAGEVSGVSAQALWETVTSNVFNDHPVLRAQLGTPGSTEAVVTAQTRLASSILRWWHTHYRAWSHGVCGFEGRQRSAELAPDRSRVIHAQAQALLARR